MKQDVRFITTLLDAMTREQAGAAAFHHVEQLRQLAKAIRAQHGRGIIRSNRRLLAGVSAASLQRCLDALEVAPVLTAHPTEAKRRTTRNHSLRLATPFDQADEIRERRVTPQVSLATVARQRARLTEFYRRECDTLIGELTHASPARRKRAPVADPFQSGEVYRRKFLALTVNGIAFGMKSTG